jgi:hypothetical protein
VRDSRISTAVRYRCLTSAETTVRDSRISTAVRYRCLTSAETTVRDSRISTAVRYRCLTSAETTVCDSWSGVDGGGCRVEEVLQGHPAVGPAPGLPRHVETGQDRGDERLRAYIQRV